MLVVLIFRKADFLDCLIEFYNEDKLSDLTAILAFKPKKVIVLCGGTKEKKIKRIKNLKKACLFRLPDLSFEYKFFDDINLSNIVNVFSNVIHENPESYLNITGASELGAIGAYLACAKNFVPIFKLDLRKNKIINIKGCNSLGNKDIPCALDSEILFLANGANVSGNNHPTPPTIMHSNILKFCSFVFNDIENWKKLCYYLQICKNHYPQTEKANLFWAPKVIGNITKEAKFDGEHFLMEAEKLNLIYDLDICDETVSFDFKNDIAKYYFTDFGGWLELYCYIRLIESQKFRDVKISVKINWDQNLHDFINVINEVDITFFYNNIPCFLSCKIAEPSSAALQELLIYSSFFGGKYSKTILVTLARLEKKYSKFCKRAKNMGVLVIDKNDLENYDLAGLIEQALIFEDSSFK